MQEPSIIKPGLFSSPTFNLTSMWHCVDCWNATMIWVLPQRLAERNFPHFIAADVLRHQQTSGVTDFEGFVRNQPVFRSDAVLQLVRKTWPPLWTVSHVEFYLSHSDWLERLGDWHCEGNLESSVEIPVGTLLSWSTTEGIKAKRKLKLKNWSMGTCHWPIYWRDPTRRGITGPVDGNSILNLWREKNFKYPHTKKTHSSFSVDSWCAVFRINVWKQQQQKKTYSSFSVDFLSTLLRINVWK